MRLLCELVNLLLPPNASAEDAVRAQALVEMLMKVIEAEARKAVELHENTYHGGDY